MTFVEGTGEGKEKTLTEDATALDDRAIASGWSPSGYGAFSPTNNPTVGFRTNILKEEEVYQGEDPSDQFVNREISKTDPILQSEYINEFAAMGQTEQESYALAMYLEGWGDRFGIESIDDIYEPYVIQGMLEIGLGRAADSALIGRRDQLPSFDQGLADQANPTVSDVLAKLNSDKPEVRYMDRAGLELSADTYFQRTLGRDAKAEELNSFVSGIYAAQASGLSGQEINVAGRAAQAAEAADPRRAEGIQYSQAAARVMNSLKGMAPR
tara:strand:+ start:4647 stop:5453 length:807 start_codon:yes stop_codon:yes gene_type:complete